MNLLQVWMIELAIIFASGLWRREIKEECFLVISHRLDPLISVVDYWIEMTSQGISHVKEVTITQPLTSQSSNAQREGEIVWSK